MAAWTVSELANWDGRLDQHRQNSKWRRSASTLTRDSHHAPFESQSLEVFQSPARILDQKRAEKSASRSNHERESLTNATESTRYHSRVDTTSNSLGDIQHDHRHSISHGVPSPALPPPPFVTSSKSSHFTPNSSVLASRVHNSRPSSRGHVASLQPAPTTEADVIDLTFEDTNTEDEQSIRKVLTSNIMHSSDEYPDPGPSRRPPSRPGPPIPPEQSLFTRSLPPKRRTRVCIDCVAVPTFPKGLTKADYQPVFGHSAVSLPRPTSSGTLEGSTVSKLPVTKESTPPRKWKGKERERDVVSSPGHARCTPGEVDAAPSASLDAFLEHAMIPLQDEDMDLSLATLGLATNTRFHFAHLWRGYVSRLREAEFDWTFEFSLFGKACIWVRSMDLSSPRIPGTTSFVSSEQLRSWELVPPHSTPQEKSSEPVSDEQADATGGYAVAEDNADRLSLPDDALLASTVTFDPALSNSPLSQGLSSTVVDMDHDMSQYFNGLSDSPNKHAPRPQPAPMQASHPHLFQSASDTQMDSFDLGFPSLELDSRLADTSGHECFLGVPPSPATVDIESSIAPGLTPDPPFEPVNGFTASSSSLFARHAPPMDGWSFEQGESLVLDNGSPPDDHAASAAPSTIDPSLLGAERHQTSSRSHKDTSSKRRSKLPEPIIYVRRPIDSSSLPLISGRRPVRIKYRDSGGSLATSSTQSPSKQASSRPVEYATEPSVSDTNRPSVPSRKLRECPAAYDSDSDYIPEVSKPSSEAKPKSKHSSVKDKKLSAEHQGTGATIDLAKTCCHQCRNRSTRPKMLCSNDVGGRVCGKRFCNRCILYRYPDITFDEHSASFLCPACTNTCNCSLCSRNRGEKFVSMRLGRLATSILKTKVTFVRDGDVAFDRPRSPPDADVVMDEPQTHFWAHVYGLEGERMGSAFMTREHMDRLDVRGPSMPPSLAKKALQPRSTVTKAKPRRREKKRGPRVFIGCPLQSWKVRAVRDLEPSVDVETIWGNDGRTAAFNGPSCRRRCYIGGRAALHEPYRRMRVGETGATPPPTPAYSDGSRTPVSEVEMDDWPQPEVGKWCSWAPSLLLPLPSPPSPPSTVVHGCLPDPFLSVGELHGLGAGPDGGVVGGDTEAVGLQESMGMCPSYMDVDTDVVGDTGIGAAATVGQQASGLESMAQVLSEEDVARAISAALAALNAPLSA